MARATWKRHAPRNARTTHRTSDTRGPRGAVVVRKYNFVRGMPTDSARLGGHVPFSWTSKPSDWYPSAPSDGAGNPTQTLRHAPERSGSPRHAQQTHESAPGPGARPWLVGVGSFGWGFVFDGQRLEPPAPDQIVDGAEGEEAADDCQKAEGLREHEGRQAQQADPDREERDQSEDGGHVALRGS